MPAAIPILAAYAATSAAVSLGWVVAGTLAASVVFAGTMVAVGLLLAPKPPSMDQSLSALNDIGAGRTQQVRQPITAHQFIYGTVKTSGPVVFIHSAIDDEERENGYLYLIHILAAHHVSEIGDIYIGDDSPSSVLTQTIAKTKTGSVPGAPHQVTIAEVFVSVERVRILPLGFPLTDVSPAAPGIMEYSLSGNTFTFNAARIGDNYIIEYSIENELSRVTKHLGTSDQAADTDFVAEIGSAWTADHRLRGRAYLATRLKQNSEVFPAGVPNIAAIVKGMDSIYDPRSGSTGWSENPALCIANWFTSNYGMGLAWSELDEAAVIAAANVCDELVPVLAGGTVKRYTCNGTFNADMAKRDVLKQMLSSMAGVAVYMGGKWTIHAGVPATPTLTLNEYDLRGSLVNMPKRSMRDRFNGVRAVYIDPNARWQPVDAPPLLNAGYVAEDGGETLYQDLRFPFTTDTATVQRLMKIELERNRRQGTVGFPAKLTALRLAPWDGVYLSIDRYQWAQKQYRVTGWAIGADASIDLTLQEDDAGIYAWVASEEVTPAVQPTVTVPDSGSIAMPASITVSTPDSPTYVLVDATWDAVNSIFFAGYDAEFRQAGGTTWTSYGQVSSPSMSVSRSAATDVRAQARTTAGVVSGWRESLAPQIPSGESAVGGVGKIDVSWTNGAGAASVHVFVNTADALASATLLTTVSGTTHSHTGLGAGATRYYWLRSLASDGNFSNETASVTATST